MSRGLPRLRQSPTDPAFVQDPYPFYARARALGDLVVWEDYGMVVATTHRAVGAILKDRRMGRAPLVPRHVPEELADFYAIEAHSMLELEPPRHTRLRALVLRAFTSRRIAALEPDINALCHRLIEGFPSEPFDLIGAYAQRVPVIVIARLLGVPEAMADRLLGWSNAMVKMYQAGRTEADEQAAARAAREFADFLRGYIDARRNKPADDLITHLIAAEEDGARLSTDELISTCVLLLNAGHEATVHTMGNGLAQLLTMSPRPAITDALVEEVLRHDPPLHLFTRHVYEDLEMFGVQIPRGTELGCLLGAANRDPAVWPDPDVFDPTRPVKTNMAFGAGLHFCVGAPLARLELKVALDVLLSRCPELRLTEAPRYADLFHFHGLERLMVQVDGA